MISHKYNTQEASYFASLPDLISKHNAINLADGYTGFHCAPQLVNLAHRHLSEGLNQYAPLFGEISLKEKIAAKVEKNTGHYYHPDREITVTSGAAHAAYSAITALIGEGDEVIVFEPVNEHYSQAIKMNGGIPVYVELKEPDFHIDWEDLTRMINTKTKMMIINTPHNPTGFVMTELDMIRLQKILNGTNIILLCDETFEHMVFDSGSHQRMSAYPKLAERSIVVVSMD